MDEKYVTVKELIEMLKAYNPDAKVIVCDEIEGNDCPFVNVETYGNDAVLLRWSTDERF